MVNFVPALAYHFCLALLAAFTQPGDHILAEPCTIPNSALEPVIIIFLQIISYDSARGGVSVITDKGAEVTSSFLVMQHARPSDSGTYSCSPSLGDPVAVNVHVLRGE